MRNDGKQSEEIFDDAWTVLGKRAHVFTFVDTAKATGMNRKKVNTGAQPSDRLVTFEGVIHYAEIKSSIDPDVFKFSLLRPTQSAYAAFVLAAGGPYFVYFHSLPYDRWFRIPYQVIKDAKAAGRGSLKIEELEPYAWTFPI